MEVLRFDVGFGEMVKLALTAFVAGYRGVVVFRYSGKLVYFGTETTPLFVFVADEPEACADSDYYVVRRQNGGGVTYECRRGLVDADELERYNFIMVVRVGNLEGAEV